MPKIIDTAQVPAAIPAGDGRDSDADALPQPATFEHVMHWRRCARGRLRSQRMALPAHDRAVISQQIAGNLSRLIARCHDPVSELVIAGYWPIKGEPDLRQWLADIYRLGAAIALPVVAKKAAPLIFRPWTPETPLVKGVWNIIEPHEAAGVITPDIVLAPCLGWTSDGYRLGYGGGYFDRTLAALAPRPFSIGIALDAAHLATIHPQPHDMAFDAIVTESGIHRYTP